ncbi:MAG TPA: glycosyltransferase family 87 protein [Gemmatimonadaceae bacterium]|nr:glycosyltransferase family 87 protein [Gemmatimonadaceae bacterium]
MTDLRIGKDRVRLYGVGLALIGLSQLRFVSSVGHYWDWPDFYVAGATAGTRALLDPAAHAAWGTAHQLPVTAFAYAPGFAWLLAPAAHLSIPWGFALNAILMSVAAVFAALLASRVYSIDRAQATYMTIGWAPVTAAVVTGQNSPLGLLLSLVAIDGLQSDDALRAGLAVGALGYKPTYVLPFGLLLLLYRKWKALGVVAACGVGWYVLSAYAAGGDWMWPRPYLESVASYVGPDFAYNRAKAVSLPGVLMVAGVSSKVAFPLGMALLIGALVWLRVRGADLVQAASFAGAIAVATSPHAWPYDAAVALPGLFWIAAKGQEPARTRAIVVAYAVAPTWLAAHVLGFDLFAIVVIGGAAWVVGASGNRRSEEGLGPKLPNAETS